MAKLISPLFSQIKGSIGNTTFYDTPVNPICSRSRVSPFNPNSERQLISRLSFLQAVAAWSLLSSAQRQDYHDLALSLKSSYPSLVKTSNGRSLFCRLFSVQQLMAARDLITFSNLINIDMPYVAETPQTIAAISPLTGIGTGFVITIWNYHAYDLTWIAELSPPLPLTTYFYSGSFDWDHSGSGSINQATGPGSPGSVVGVYSTLLPNKAYFVRIRLISKASLPGNWSSLPVVYRGESYLFT